MTEDKYPVTGSFSNEQKPSLQLPPISFISGLQRPVEPSEKTEVKNELASRIILPSQDHVLPVSAAMSTSSSPQQQQQPGLPKLSSFDSGHKSRLNSILNSSPEPRAPATSNITSLLNDEPGKPQTRVIIHQHHPSSPRPLVPGLTPSSVSSVASPVKKSMSPAAQAVSPQKPPSPPKAAQFTPPVTLVNNKSALELTSKFPRTSIGTVEYNLGPQMTLSTMVTPPTTPKEEIYMIPELRNSINGLLTVKISKKYLTRRHNPNLSVVTRRLWGTDIYTDDSDIVAILKHCGVIGGEEYDDVEGEEGEEGEVEVEEAATLRDMQNVLGPIKRVVRLLSNTEENKLNENGEQDRESDETRDETRDDTHDDTRDETRDEAKDETRDESGAIAVKEDTEAKEVVKEGATKETALKSRGDLTVEVLILPTLKEYTGSFRNGINSRTWKTSHDGVSIGIYSVKWSGDEETEETKEGEAETQERDIKKRRVE